MNREEKQIVEAIRYDQYKANAEKKANAMGYEQAITTLTGIKAGVVEQKFYELLFPNMGISDFMPVRVGENAWSEELIQFMDYINGGDFEEGYIDTGFMGARLAEVNSNVGAKKVKVKTWAKAMSYTLADVEKAQRGVGNAGWSKITAQERARKKDFDLGFQRIAFLGAETDEDVKGLLTQDDVTINGELITKPISAMTSAETSALIKELVGNGVANSDDTVMPDMFVIPLSDWLGLDVPYSDAYPMVSKREYLIKAFQTATLNPNAKVLAVAYADKERNAGVLGGTGKQCYALYKYDGEAGRIEMPVAYTSTQVGTQDGFTWKSVAYAQHTGFKQFREKEMLYFRY